MTITVAVLNNSLTITQGGRCCLRGCAERDGASSKASFHQKTMPAQQTITTAAPPFFSQLYPISMVHRAGALAEIQHRLKRAG